MAAVTLAGGSNRILQEILKGSRRCPASLAPGCWGCSQGAKRYLLRDDAVGLKDFQQKKLATKSLMSEDKDTYFRNIEEKMEKNRMILKIELKRLLHLCQTSDDVEIARKVIYRYHSENRNVSFGDYKFGPIFMRLCYELDLEILAKELIKDENLYGFFSDVQSFNILMDKLFTKGHYEGAYEMLEEMKKQHVRFTTDTYLLAFAICYKLNSPATWKVCTELLEEAQLKEIKIGKRAYVFAIVLALKQNDIEKARYIYSLITKKDDRLCTNLKILIETKSGALELVLKTLKETLEVYTSPLGKAVQVSEEVLTTIREELTEDSAFLVELEDICNQLRSSGQVTSLTVDEMMCHVPFVKKYSTTMLSKEKRVSRRTFLPLQSTLIAE
uniref:Pentatricopeptide repeat-containing protein 2, mitochondrial n=1 Tax=Pelusios castaneus TaxID=367368 RepID=A0A8C8RKW8_9SAUR